MRHNGGMNEDSSQFRFGYSISFVERLRGHRVAQCNVILYASPGKEGLYSRLGFRKMKTGMARFVNLERMESMGFIEPASTSQRSQS